MQGWLARTLRRPTHETASGFRPRLVALDIDGTLVDGFGVMPPEVHAAVRRVVDNGVPVVLSTGRSWLATRTVFDELGLPPGWAVSSNGAMVVTYPPFEVRHESRFDPAAVVTRVAQLAPQARIAVQDGLDWRVNKEFPPGELLGDITFESVEQLASRPVSRVIVRDPESTEEKFSGLVSQLGLHEVSYFIGWSAWLDIAPQGVDKAHGLQIVCDDLGIDRADVLAIGDGRNDIEMLEWAGRGVAMGDAPDEVKAAADAVTGGFQDLGTVEELDRWFADTAAVAS
ncbi:Cof subfamily of IIB subfamily of haloacid dehalogenase superfamily/HAD-superfamily hydrolase, subfamily IIB [Tessaracoccus bendigoensis DSM 12906]|uniref:Cof subfamily of IIB subfamily of haloacid dehalogenase superfamily/HAD-superfamily hydrolase, subfamily IIB n=1 Tax=Tessaracoccus bendigoensis DSM 12906 TaxID=1123357 RepID=A0A1M6DKQ2_9ACTN|nr:HAD family hydrolase [Tessaracoccus bendigoensis]SHI73609.1 Cof subfamily of IIB subfamily of haloacid dehalogenase superfamily/HAD-superfamily hydrolase, subfamily IIB [Tessaracoccus bendigoensis DSM 12906]